MQAETSKTPRAVRLHPLSVSLSLSLLLALCAAGAKAQTTPSTNTASEQRTTTSTSAATTNTRTRTRRVNEAVNDASANESTSTSEANTNEERTRTLREQIAAATDAEEVARLQRTLVEHLIALDKKPEAIAELRAMMRAERFDPVGFYNIGNALARLGDTDTAIDAYRKAIKQRNGNYSRALNNLGVVLLRQGRWDEASEALTSALRLESFRYAEASYNLGRLYAARGEADLAIKQWTRALYVQTDHRDAAIALARALAEDGSPERALAVLDVYVKRNQGQDAQIAAARREIIESSAGAHDDNRRSTNVRDNVSRAVVSSERRSSDNRHTESVNNSSSRNTSTSSSSALRTLSVNRETYDLLQRARAARENNRHEEAVALYRRVLAQSGHNYFPPANLELSYTLISLNRREEAIESLLTLTNRDGARYPVAYYHLGRLYELSDKLNLAEEAFDKAASLNGQENPQFFLDVSRVREKTNNFAGALTAMESYVRVSQQRGHVPEWTTQRLTELRQKVTSSTQTSTAK